MQGEIEDDDKPVIGPMFLPSTGYVTAEVSTEGAFVIIGGEDRDRTSSKIYIDLAKIKPLAEWLMAAADAMIGNQENDA